MITSTITIEGRLAEDPTVLDNLTEIVVLTNRRKPDDTGEWVTTDTSRFVVKAFKTLGTKTGEQLHKGDQVIVAGSIVTDTWTDNDTNQNRYRQVILADAIGTSL
jgi:single-stranded DNA-binding protein